VAVLIFRTISELRMKNTEFSLDDIIRTLKGYNDEDKTIKAAAINRFTSAESWGLFSEKGTLYERAGEPRKHNIA
jgi:hypothetical protein